MVALSKPFSASLYAPQQPMRIGFKEVREAARGQWEHIHKALGIRLQTTSHRKHTPCQGCGGKDRFRVNEDYAQTGRWLCGGGGNLQYGDGFVLLGHVFGWDSKQQLQAVKDALGLDSRMEEHERLALQQQAEEREAMYLRAVRDKEARLRRDSQVLEAMYDLEELIKQREYQYRTQRAFPPDATEIAAAKELNTCILEVYKGGQNG